MVEMALNLETYRLEACYVLELTCVKRLSLLPRVP